MDPLDWIAEFYIEHLEEGWSLPDIDAMDIVYYFHLKSYKRRKEETEDLAELDKLGFL